MSETTWAERRDAFCREIGRQATLDELLALSRLHTMTADEVLAQQASWVRAFTTGCEHGNLDFETCPKCAEARNDESRRPT